MRRLLRRWLGIKYSEDRIIELDLQVKQQNKRIAALERLRADLLRRIADIEMIKPHDPNKHEERIYNLELRTDPSHELILGRLAGLDSVTQAHAGELASMAPSKACCAWFQEAMQKMHPPETPKVPA